MATVFLPSIPSSSTCSTSSSSINGQKHNLRGHFITQCKAVNDNSPLSSPVLSKRSLSISFTTTFLISLAGKGYFDANAAILEADDDLELLEKVKKDRKKRIEKQGVISSSNKETGKANRESSPLRAIVGNVSLPCSYLQDVIYKLSEVGQAIENNDLPAASSVLGQTTDTEWIKKANAALTKLSSSSEEKTEADAFYSSLSSLISSVIQKDIEASKVAFVASASAFEKWTNITGLVGQLKGL
ncbi:hypothetical protein RJ640_010036 [Escallonia rubra]|uniref:Maintenance of Photosystem II under High light 2 C-terminal domain-containing protein n=1 Tax=Escallonia rubra TaxID=112253 RepID=A0AA88QJH2_9ASTE|nr:hypothetical protein RJ640_010036 [Escallonia rubra]